MAEFVITDESSYMAGMWGGVPNVEIGEPSSHKPEYYKIPYRIIDNKILAKRLEVIKRRLLNKTMKAKEIKDSNGE